MHCFTETLGGRARGARPRLPHFVLGHRHLQERARAEGRRARGAARAHAHRDRFAVSRAGAVSRQAQSARVRAPCRRGDRAAARRVAWTTSRAATSANFFTPVRNSLSMSIDACAAASSTCCGLRADSRCVPSRHRRARSSARRRRRSTIGSCESVAIDRSDDVAALLARGMDPNTVDPNGEPVLVVAARAGWEPTVDAAAARPAPRSTRRTVSAIPRSWSRRSTAISCSSRSCFARGAEINPPDGRRSPTPPPTARPRSCATCSRSAPRSTRSRRMERRALMMAVRGGHAADGRPAARQGRRRQSAQSERCERAGLGDARRLRHHREGAAQARRQTLTASAYFSSRAWRARGAIPSGRR